MNTDKTLRGNIEDLPLVDILQVLHMQKKTGSLILQCRAGEGMIVVKDGMIVYAISPNQKMNLADLLVNRGVVSEKQLKKALEIQKSTDYNLRLSSILADLNILSEATLNKYISWQIENAVYDLFTWEKGEFYFEIGSVLFAHKIAIDPENLSLDYGVSPQYLIWEASTKLSPTIIEDLTVSQSNKASKKTSSNYLPDKLKQPPMPKNDKVFDEVEVLFNNLTDEEEKKSDNELELATSETGLVLIVDDETYYRRLLSDILTNKGYSVIGATNGTTALEELERYNKGAFIIAAIIDVIMPEQEGSGILGGFELLSKLVLNYPELQIFMISASSDPELPYSAYELGARNYLQKPNASSSSLKDSRINIERFVDELSFCLEQVFTERDQLVKIRKAEKKIEKKEASVIMVSLSDLNELQRKISSHTTVQESLFFLLQVARQHFDKGILYLVRNFDMIGLMGFDNILPQPTFDWYSKIRFDRNEKNIYSKIVNYPFPYIGKLKGETEGWSILENELNSFVLGEHYIVPLVYEGNTYALLDLCSEKRFSANTIERFELILLHIGLLIQKALLQLKLTKRKGKNV